MAALSAEEAAVIDCCPARPEGRSQSATELPERRVFNVQNLSAEEAAPQEGARLQKAYGYRERPQGTCTP
jgi:hypothetical protein